MPVESPALATPAGAAPGARPLNERALLFTLAGIQFTHIVDFMVMMPLGPQFTQIFGITDAQFGLLVSAYTLAAGVSGLAASGFVDRFERKRLLLSLYFGFALATLACGLAPTYGTLMIARTAAGLFGGVMGAMVQTVVGDAIPYERRGRAMGVVMGSFSLATVAGVPLSLYLASHWGWHAAFVSIAVASGVVLAVGLRALPRLSSHVAAARSATPLQGIMAVLRDPNHWRAFGFTALVMATGFSVIPYVTIYLTSNAGLDAADVPLVYLVGGVTTFFSARLIGACADRWGKVATFRAVALAVTVPLVTLTHLGRVPLWVVLLTTTLFFVCMSGRMVPGMAIVTAATVPQVRGTFMSLNTSVQSAAMGVASLLGGLVIGRGPGGEVTGYALCGWFGVAMSLLSVVWVARVRVAPAGR